MIISASRRCDIPTYFSQWFYKRIREEFVLVRNPFNFRQISRISLSPDVVDGIVFWTKNPAPMLDRLDELKEYEYYFQFTVTPYGTDIEPNIPSKEHFMIPTFQNLSQKIGKERIIWRYDPVILSEKYTIEYHIEHFEKFARQLAPYVRKCTFSFLDMYKSTEKNVKGLNIYPISQGDMFRLAKEFSDIAAAYHLKLSTCAENIDLYRYKISHAHCVDRTIFEELGGYGLNIDKDRNQRSECGCDASIDIGTYNSCINGCRYCYANFSSAMAAANFAGHDPLSPLLYGTVGPQDVIKERMMRSCKELQKKLFE
ncbi:hypothetical protein SDC9_74327 [bioreactor metagenome]|uniref:DUF1848 domain-containing protein n=1 Tax=bioreactor metagenome TaxID=1076179 RepID=A0A644YMT5_9ZZZZ